ncbi:zinc finger protein [Saccharopolyspora spinosa]|uniref:Zinc finger protein n=1 Tax=Saccharopolyspora spinosa TaxID=60894 RepID=A0A2N3XQL2_SACSN|nr:zinc finger protein [Saccharopolyspora spinosa]PKW12922.1 zinc finger protein [Saccharopolyspora spinosa]
MSDYLTYVWRPVTGGRHAFPITATKVPAGDQVVAFCGAESNAVELHDWSEVDWIREGTCMDCWHVLTIRPCP